MQPLVKITALTKQFGHLMAVDHLSFSVEPASVYGFLGQNGAGKSTTIRMLTGLIMPTSGEIEIFGLSLAKHKKEILQQIGAVIEKPDVYQYLSAYDNLQLFARLSGIRPTRVSLMDQLAQVGLAERAKDKVAGFSQGMKQRLGIAIALVHQPQLIILDEPTNGLDPQGIADIRHLIIHLRTEMKKTVIVSSHLLSEIEQVATQLLIIHKGKKVKEGNASELFDPAQTVVQLSTEQNESAWAVLQNSDWQPNLERITSEGIILKVDRRQIPALHQSLVQLQIPLISLQPRHSLEDYFLQVTTPGYVDTLSN
jgi:ABC-type multidrug transport system ATPase subunit